MIRETLGELVEFGRVATGRDDLGETIRASVESGRDQEDRAVCGVMGDMICRLADMDVSFSDDALTLKHLLYETGLSADQLPISDDNQAFIATIIE